MGKETQVAVNSLENVGHAADEGLQYLRRKMRSNIDRIFSHIMSNYFPRKRPKNFKPRCIFCWSKEEVTKEHVMPRWVFEQSGVNFFNSTTNNFKFIYNKTSVPVCATCNNIALSALERYITNKFNFHGNLHSPLDRSDVTRLIRWFEIIDYKFHVMNMIKRFIKYKGIEFDENVADMPLSMLRRDATPQQAVHQLARAMKRIGIQSKNSRYNSFLQFNTRGKEFNFFHSMDNFIFLEFPRYGTAFFYFYRRSFLEHHDAHSTAVEIIKENY